ncbi:MAG: penicillin-binding protein 2, partial [Alphaproteobacteria bacterium]|nr:penicillin-binding protein 2 [Alphaproteobacteria bacterium]
MTGGEMSRSIHAAAWQRHRVHLEGTRKQALETGRNRLLVTGVVFALAFLAIAGRLVDLTVLGSGAESRLAAVAPARAATSGRADITDRNGVILATSLPTVSLYADPTEVLDAEEAADKLVGVLPGLDRSEVLAKLTSRGRFVWLRRILTPTQHYAVNRLGIPGLAFQRGEHRVYPHGRTAAHLLGFTDVDGRGIAGLERRFDETLRRGGPLRLSVDLRLQAMLREELSAAFVGSRALGAAGLVLDVKTGEILALASLPDFDPNRPATA